MLSPCTNTSVYLKLCLNMTGNVVTDAGCHSIAWLTTASHLLLLILSKTILQFIGETSWLCHPMIDLLVWSAAHLCTDYDFLPMCGNRAYMCEKCWLVTLWWYSYIINNDNWWVFEWCCHVWLLLSHEYCWAYICNVIHTFTYLFVWRHFPYSFTHLYYLLPCVELIVEQFKHAALVRNHSHVDL